MSYLYDNFLIYKKMDKISINVFKSKVPLNIIVLYGILFIIALLWTDRELNPNIALRTIFIIFFSIPLLKYSYLTPVILTIFYCIRVFSIGVGGYLPSQSEFFIILLIMETYIHYQHKFNRIVLK